MEEPYGSLTSKLKNALENFSNEKIENQQNPFDSLANLLMNNHRIKSGDSVYSITEIEFYFHSKEHADPYTHCDDEQFTCCKWYFNGMGLDLTFGNKDKKIHGGILIRGIKKPEDKPVYIDGPSNVLKELFSCYEDAFTAKSGICLIEFPNENNTDKSKLYRAKRVGLPLKKEDPSNFRDKKYRYIADLNKEHKFKGKEEVIIDLIKAGDITKETGVAVLEYTPKILK